MAHLRVKCGAIEMNVNGGSEVIAQERGAFYDYLSHKIGDDVRQSKERWERIKQAQQTGKPAAPTQQPAPFDHDVVAIYDNAGIPSIMHRFRKTTNKELFGGSAQTHPAFIIGEVEYDEIYISVYPNTLINGKPYSLPHMKAATNIDNDKASRLCFDKGEGWHMMTAAEWGLLANISLKNGTLPHGNTNTGRYHADANEKGEIYDSCLTLTGSGPATWTHDHTPEGVHDLCGNVWEMLRGLRLMDGGLQVIKNNDAALDINHGKDSPLWDPMLVDDEVIRISASDGIRFTTDDVDEDYTGSRWGDVKFEHEPTEQMKALALFPGEPDAYIYADTDGERFPSRGGGWAVGTYAGVFSTSLADSRTFAPAGIGFRSAFFRKTEN